MSQPNPFLNRGSLAGLIARRNQITPDSGDSPFNLFMKRQRQRQIDEGINQYGQRAMQPRPMPQAPMPQAPMPQAPMPQAPMPPSFGVMGPATGSPGGQVTVTGGNSGGYPGLSVPQQMPPMSMMPAAGGGWNALGLGGFGGFDPSKLQQQRGFGYDGGFGGFSAAQPYRGMGGGGFARLF